MFTVAQIELAHEKVESGADFPSYIKEIKFLGVISFETWVFDSHTVYFGANNFQTKSEAQYEKLEVVENCNPEKFKERLKLHQEGKTDYFTFCNDCASTGIEKWVVSIDKLTCTYFDKQGNMILEESIPG